MTAEGSPSSTDFIRTIIEHDVREGKYGGRVHTVFLPNPMAIFILVMPNPSV